MIITESHVANATMHSIYKRSSIVSLFFYPRETSVIAQKYTEVGSFRKPLGFQKVRTRRERLKSALYLRLKKRKRLFFEKKT